MKAGRKEAMKERKGNNMNGPGMETRIAAVETAGFRMDYFRFGRGGKTLVILPGLSVDSVIKYADTVAEAYRGFAEKYTVYVFDRRKGLPAVYPVSRMAEDTAAAIRALGLTDIYLFGVSQGGMIAMAAAAAEPELVRKMVLGSTAARMDRERYRTVGRWVELAEGGDAEGLYLAFGEAVYPPEAFEKSKGLLAAAAASVTREDLGRFVILAEGMKGFDMTEKLKAVACPVLVIGSADDRVLGADAAGQIAGLLKDRTDCELYMYDGFGHAAYDTAPDYKERILRFLGK